MLYLTQATAQQAGKAEWCTEWTCTLSPRYQQEVGICVSPNQVNDCIYYSWAFSVTWSCKVGSATSPSASRPSLFALHSSLHPPVAHLASPSCGINLPASTPLRFAPLSPNCQFVFRSSRTAWSVRLRAGGFRVAPAGPVPDQSLGNVVATSKCRVAESVDFHFDYDRNTVKQTKKKAKQEYLEDMCSSTRSAKFWTITWRFIKNSWESHSFFDPFDLPKKGLKHMTLCIIPVTKAEYLSSSMKKKTNR